MTNTEAADIVQYLVGAYPGTYFKGPTAEVFVNSLMTSQSDIATKAALQWVETMDHFPTMAELNGIIRQLRNRENEDRQLPRAGYQVADKPEACEAFSRGYIKARTQAGEAMETIQPKLDRLLRQWNLAPTIAGERRARTDSDREPRVPSARRPGYLRSSTAPPVDQPAFGSTSSDEPW